MIRIEAGVLAISMRKFPREKKKEFYIEAIDKVKMKNSRLSEIAKKINAGVQIFKMQNVYGCALSLDRQDRLKIRFVSGDEFIDDVFTFEGFEQHHLDAFPRTDH